MAQSRLSASELIEIVYYLNDSCKSKTSSSKWDISPEREIYIKMGPSRIKGHPSQETAIENISIIKTNLGDKVTHQRKETDDLITLKNEFHKDILLEARSKKKTGTVQQSTSQLFSATSSDESKDDKKKDVGDPKLKKMNPNEKQILEFIQSTCLKEAEEDAFSGLLTGILYREERILGSTSIEFINHPDVVAYITRFPSGGHNGYLSFWLQIESYLHTKDTLVSQAKLSKVEDQLKKCFDDMAEQAKGDALLPRELVNPVLIKKLYLTNDEKLISLFLKYLPAPRSNVFVEHPLPDFVAKREQISTQIIRKILANHDHNVGAVEDKIIKIQRLFRAKKRSHEEHGRIKNQYKHEDADTILRAANTPYTPQCEQALARRILQATKNIKLFSTVRHWTTGSGLENIFNDCLFGRRTLLQFLIPHTPILPDVANVNGDGNVICLGANIIHPMAVKSGRVELTFDVQKIAKNNPCAFYKQRDLEYNFSRVRSIKIGDFDLRFSHTDSLDIYLQAYSVAFKVFGPYSNKTYNVSRVKNDLLIAYNLEKMHQILVLNFFRFIDNLMEYRIDSEHKDENNTKKQVYSALGRLNDQELRQALQQIGENITDSMEFNFYGAYKIDFSALISIKKFRQTWESPAVPLHLPSFIEDLNAGKLEKLAEGIKEIPEIFKSWRFIEYLLSKIKNPPAVFQLEELRNKCMRPSWMQSTVEAKM